MSQYFPSVNKRESASVGRPAAIPLQEVAVLRSARLVPWAKGKCERCGSTLCEDPLPHDCTRHTMRAVDYGKCVLL